MKVPHLQRYQILEVVKQNALNEKATTDEMKENHNILPQSVPISATKSSVHMMNSTIGLRPYIGNGAATPESTTYAHPSDPSGETGPNNLHMSVGNSARTVSPSTPVFHDRDASRRLSAGNNSSSSTNSGSETDTSRSPMSLCDSSVESSPEGSGVARASPVVPAPVETSTPLQAPQQPVRRRPGRPPGSTKKRMQSYAEYRKKEESAQSADDFSLRKFFEAGGRDYNEYLDWLKKRQAQQSTTPIIMSQVSSFPTIPASAMTSAGVHSAQTTHAVPLPQFAARPTALNGTKNPVVLPPPAYRPMLVPRPSTATLPPGVQHDMIPIPGAVPSLTAFPMIHTQSAISPPLRPPTSVHQPQTLPPAPLLQDNNALDLSAPTRKRKSEGSCSGDESLSPAPSSAKLLRDVTGSPVEITPIPKSPSDRDFYPDSNATTTASVYKPDINGNLMVSGSVGGSTETADLVESSTEPDISSWDVDGVVKFINSIPGCQEYSEVFREHRIDGATLPHLSEEHLLNFVKMKLGPAIRLRLAIARLRLPVAQ